VRLALNQLVESVEIPSEPVPIVDVEGHTTPGEIAELLRARWRIPPGPIEDVTEIIERHGIFVIESDFAAPKIDAISLARDELPAVIIVNRATPGDRMRFTLAHELAHIVMHHHLVVPPPNCEAEADEFAAHFLMPTREIRAAFGRRRLGLNNLVEMKPRWGVAIQALVERARSLRLLSERQRTYLYKQISLRGWRRNEPAPIQREEPRLLAEVLEAFENDLGYSLEEIASAAQMSVSDIYEFHPRPGLRVI
jgi:Zn-dependent peptidase ImmA (M78 family)